jgi:hypothetical protein
MRKAYTIFIRKSEGGNSEDLDIDGSILEWILKK